MLLKNTGVLPIRDTTTKLAVIGPNAVNRVSQLGDWGIRFNFGKQDHEMVDDHSETYVSVLDGIKAKYSDVSYHYGCTVNTEEHDIDAAVALAENCDVIITVIGDNLGLNGEIKDRATLDLPGRQLELLKALKALNKPIVAVLITGKPLILNWLDEHVDAILETFNPGLEGGNAIANILSGMVNPSGKLTMSFPRHVGQLPVYYNQIPGWHGNANGTGDYIDMTAEPLYHFGYGLSYTAFQYSDLQLLTEQPTITSDITIEVTIKNIGLYDGQEIVQVYVNDLYSSATTPKKVLIAYQKIAITKNNEVRIQFVLDNNSFSFIDRNLQRVVEPGRFILMVGPSSYDDDLLKLEFEMNE